MVLFIFAGALIRQYFVLMHRGQIRPGYPIAGVALILVAVWVGAPAPKKAVTAPAPVTQSSVVAPDAGTDVAAVDNEIVEGEAPAAVEAADGEVTLAQVEAVMNERCVQCHAVTPDSKFGFSAPPLGIVLESQKEILLQGAHLKQVVANNYMPLGNMTHMTDEERALIAAWSGK